MSDTPGEITIAQVDQAEAELAAVKERYYAAGGPQSEDEAVKAEFREIKKQCVLVRQAWRMQEEAQGRRGGPGTGTTVGGDAVREG